MTAAGVDYVCIDNHECDLGYIHTHIHAHLAELIPRIDVMVNCASMSKVKWLNSNIPDLKVKLPESAVIEVVSVDKN